MRAIELLSDSPAPSALLRSYRGLGAGISPCPSCVKVDEVWVRCATCAWEGFYSAMWAESVRAVAASASGETAKAAPRWLVRRWVLGASPFHLRDFW